MWKYLVVLLWACTMMASVTSGIYVTDCGQPTVPANAYIVNWKAKYASGDRVTFKCVKGYRGGGIATIMCFMARWNVLPFRCDRVGCVDPGTPKHGSKVGISYAPGRQVFFSCNVGYVRVGSERRRCLPNNTWSGTQPTCKPTHSCKRTIRASRTRCTAKCSPDDPAGCPTGHKCRCDGQCGYSCVEEGLQCPLPSQVTNGIIKFNGTGYNDTVTYKCKENYTLNGDKIRRCTAKKRWGGAVPSCLPDCGQPRVPKNAYIEKKKPKYASGDRVTFKCVAGYNQEGIATTFCFMGRWNVMPFRCDKGGCGDPGTPENGNKVGISYAPGREVFFSCNIGYVRVGSEQRRCLINNTWSGTQPTCKLIDCGLPKVLKNGTIIGNETTFQKSISFKCDKGFELKGSASAICKSDGKWSIQPVCKLRSIRCGDPGTPMNGIKKGLSYLHGNLVFFACNFGYKIVGSMSRQCLGNSQWSGVQPKCKRAPVAAAG